MSNEVPIIRTHGYVVQVSDEVLADAQELQAALARYQQATPEERESWAERNRRERAEVRAAAERRELTIDALLDKLGWDRAYAEHLVQPYCECYDGMDGWEYCQHAYDEGLR